MKPFHYRRIIKHGTACLRRRKMLLPPMIKNGRQLLELCCRGKYPISTVASKNLTLFLIRSCLPQLSYLESCLARIQYLPAHEKDQIQDFRNWIPCDPTTRSAPESLVIGLIENAIANSPNTDMSGTSNQPNLESPKLTPSAATEGTSNADGTGSSGAEGSKTPAVRLVPF